MREPNVSPASNAGKPPIRAFDSTPGKFNNRADERTYRKTLDGCNDAIGDVQDFGWYGVIRSRLLGLAAAGAIVSEDGQGFVYVEYFDSADELEQAWARIEADAEEFYGDQDSDEDDEDDDEQEGGDNG